MKKIQNILFLCFSVFFVILGVILFQNQYISNQAQITNKNLSEEITPGIQNVNTIDALSRENLLLIFDRYNDETNIEAANRIREISEVELPHAFENLSKIKESTKRKQQLIDSIIISSKKLIKNSLDFNALIFKNSEVVNEKYLLNFINKEIAVYSFRLESSCAELRNIYQGELKNEQIELSEHLQNMSFFVILTFCFSILIGFLMIVYVTRAIVKPINKLKNATKDLSLGDFSTPLDVKSPAEIAELAQSFNQMSSSLKKSFMALDKKNKELEQFVYITSHDLQEPLKTLKALTERLGRSKLDWMDEKSKKYIDFINQSAARMSLMVAGLMEHSKIGNQAKPQECDVELILKNVSKDLKSSLCENNAQLGYRELPKIKAFPHELHLMFQNLISNAIKFRDQSTECNIEIKHSEDDEHHYFKVLDNGMGFNEKYIDKAFLIFQRLHGDSLLKGTGIGLAHCKKIAEIHKGKISIQNKSCRGAEVEFSISKKL